MPYKDCSSINFKEISLPRVRRQSRKAAENKEVFLQQTFKRARKKNIKKPKPLKKPNARAFLQYKSRRTASTGRQNQEVVDLVDSSPPKSPGPASELDTTQWQESESEPITYTLVWRIVVSNTPITNTAKRIYVYCFRYRDLINWVDEVCKKHPGQFKSTATIQAVTGYDQATKRKEILMDIHSIKDIDAIDQLLDA